MAETVAILDLNRGGIHIAECLTELPPHNVRRERFHQARVVARATPAAATEATASEESDA